MTADLMIKFMEHLLENSESKVFLIVDNLKVHHTKVVTAWLSERKARIEVFFLPPCLFPQRGVLTFPIFHKLHCKLIFRARLASGPGYLPEPLPLEGRKTRIAHHFGVDLG